MIIKNRIYKNTKDVMWMNKVHERIADTKQYQTFQLKNNGVCTIIKK